MKLNVLGGTKTVPKLHLVLEDKTTKTGVYCVAHVFGDNTEHARVNAETIAHRVNCHDELVAALGAILDNEEHAVTCGARVYQKGSPTWDLYEVGRKAIERASK